MHPQRNLITEAQNIVSEGSRGFKRTERVLGAIEKKAVKSGMNPDTMYANPEGEYAKRGRAFQLRQTDAAEGGHIAGGSPGIDTQRMEPTEGKRDAGGKRRDPLRPHGSARIGTVSRQYTSRETPSDVARADAEKRRFEAGFDADAKKAAIDRTDAGIRALSDKITSMRPEVATANHQAQVLNTQRQRQQDFPTARDRAAGVVSRVASRVKSAVGLGEETKKNTSPEDMDELIRKGIEAALKKRRAGKNDDTDSPHYKITAGEDHEEARRALRMD